MRQDAQYSANEIILNYLKEKCYAVESAKKLIYRCKILLKKSPDYILFFPKNSIQQWKSSLSDPVKFKECLEVVLNPFFDKKEKQDTQLESVVSFGLKIAEELGIFNTNRDIKKYLNLIVSDEKLLPFITRRYNRWLVKNPKPCYEYLIKQLREHFSNYQDTTLTINPEKMRYSAEDIKLAGSWNKETFEELLTDKELLKVLGDPIVERQKGQLVVGYSKSIVDLFIETAKEKYPEAEDKEALKSRRGIESVIGSSFEVILKQMKDVEYCLKES